MEVPQGTTSSGGGGASASDIWLYGTRTLTGTKNTFDDLNDIAQSDILSDATPFAGASVGAIKTQTDKLAGGMTSGTATAGTTTETTIVELTLTSRRKIHAVWLDLVNLTTDATIKLYYKIDGTDYRVFETLSWAVSSDDDGVYFNKALVFDHDLKVTLTASEGSGVSIPYEVHWEDM